MTNERTSKTKLPEYFPFDISDGTWDKLFDALVRTPESWQQSARQLKRGADLLYSASKAASRREVKRISRAFKNGDLGYITKPRTGRELIRMVDTELTSVYCMLIGLALENLTKGILIARHPNYLNAKGEFKFNRHDLKSYFEECRIRLGPSDKDALLTLYEHVVWAGRYPTPLKPSKHRPRKASDGTWLWPGQGIMDDEHDTIESLYERAWDLLEAEMTVAESRNRT
jgi:hypothetical protein